MMKRMLCLLLLACLVMSCAAAEPRYPARTGETTDAAAVLSHTTLEDLRKLDDRLDDADMPQLVIVTVDFLDGQEVQAYADALFTRWKLDEDEILLLMAVGEDKYALSAGQDVNRLISSSTQQKLLISAFEAPFLGQQYDQAIAAWAPALVQELNKVCEEAANTDGLFGRSSTGLFSQWASSLRQPEPDSSSDSLLTRVDRQTGFSLLKVILIVAVLMLFFGSFRIGGKHGSKPRH